MLYEGEYHSTTNFRTHCRAPLCTRSTYTPAGQPATWISCVCKVGLSCRRSWYRV